MTDPTATAQELRATPRSRKAGARELDGRRGGQARRANPRPAPASPRSPTPTRPPGYSRCMWRSYYNLQALYETPDLPAGVETTARYASRLAIIPAARDEGPDRAHRVRVEADPGGLRHPHRGDPRRRDRGRSRRRRRRDRVSGRPQAALAHDHAQDRRRRRAAQPDRCRGGPRAYRDDRGSQSASGPGLGTSRASACSRWSSSTATS